MHLYKKQNYKKVLKKKKIMITSSLTQPQVNLNQYDFFSCGKQKPDILKNVLYSNDLQKCILSCSIFSFEA